MLIEKLIKDDKSMGIIKYKTMDFIISPNSLDVKFFDFLGSIRKVAHNFT